MHSKKENLGRRGRKYWNAFIVVAKSLKGQQLMIITYFLNDCPINDLAITIKVFQYFLPLLPNSWTAFEITFVFRFSHCI